jgi:hypothetical protein
MSKIFPKKQKVEGPEVTSSVTSPIKWTYSPESLVLPRGIKALCAGPGCQDIINTNLMDDPRLTAENIKGFRKAYNELYDFTMVSPVYLSACMRCRIVLTRSLLLCRM